MAPCKHKRTLSAFERTANTGSLVSDSNRMGTVQGRPVDDGSDQTLRHGHSAQDGPVSQPLHMPALRYLASRYLQSTSILSIDIASSNRKDLSLLPRPLYCRLRLQGFEAGIRRVRQADDRNTAREGQMRRTGRQTRLCMPPAMLSVMPTESTVDDANYGKPTGNGTLTTLLWPTVWQDKSVWMAPGAASSRVLPRCPQEACAPSASCLPAGWAILRCSALRAATGSNALRGR